MDIVEILNYFADKYSFDEEDMTIIDEITGQLVNSKEEYDDDKYEDEDEYDYDDKEEEYIED